MTRANKALLIFAATVAIVVAAAVAVYALSAREQPGILEGSGGLLRLKERLYA